MKFCTLNQRIIIISTKPTAVEQALHFYKYSYASSLDAQSVFQSDIFVIGREYMARSVVSKELLAISPVLAGTSLDVIVYPSYGKPAILYVCH